MEGINKTMAGLVRAISYLLVMLFSVTCNVARCAPASGGGQGNAGNDQSIMLALLLDTSNSMDGLIDQAKSQLWKIVNELAAAKCNDGTRPAIKIALYEYGNSRLSEAEGYVRLVSPLTTDLDVISEKLFSLSTNGGEEYCGYVINKSLTQLEWSGSDSDLKMIFIAGNEPFNQGSMPYKTACALANEKDVIVNTIFCGDFNEGVATLWKSGADITHGTFMSIEQNRKTVYIKTPYDEKIDALNDKLNDTYIYYGSSGVKKKELQTQQDKNAEHYSLSNKVERTVSKSSRAYNNASWDLVDATTDDETAIVKADAKSLPAEMQNMTVEQRKAYVKQKAVEREKIQNEIQLLNKNRAAFITSQQHNQPQQTLDGAMIKAIKESAKTKNLSF